MHLFVIGIFGLAALVILINLYGKSSPESVVKAGRWLFVTMVLGLTLFFFMRGGFQFLWMGLLSILPWIGKFKFIHILVHLYLLLRKKMRGKKSANNTNNDRAMNGASTMMTRREALRVLGLEEGASEEEIRKAHRKLMQQHHPDQGGNVEMASLINRAKDTLLSE